MDWKLVFWHCCGNIPCWLVAVSSVTSACSVPGGLSPGSSNRSPAFAPTGEEAPSPLRNTAEEPAAPRSPTCARRDKPVDHGVLADPVQPTAIAHGRSDNAVVLKCIDVTIERTATEPDEVESVQ